MFSSKASSPACQGQNALRIFSRSDSASIAQDRYAFKSMCLGGVKVLVVRTFTRKISWCHIIPRQISQGLVPVEVDRGAKQQM